jgi:hypothetical protein
VTKQADQQICINAPAHSTAVIQALFFGKTLHHPSLSALLQPIFGSLLLLVFPTAKTAIESEEICECNGHTAHKLRQQRLPAD